MTDLLVIKVFNELEDPRNKRTKNFLYPLEEILLIALATLLSGGTTYKDMQLFGKSKLEFFKTLLPFKNGIPSQDTFEEVFGMLNPKKFEKCLIEWITYLKANYNDDIIPIDGKKIRRSGSQTSKPLHMINAWSKKNRTVLCCTSVRENSNEITAIPEVLNLLSLEGTTVTMDAMGCQINIANQIVEQKGNYVLALKGNQETLHNDVVTYLENEQTAKKDSKNITFYTTIDKDHGRIEKRVYGFSSDVAWLNKLHPHWHTIKGVGYVKSERIINEKTSFETRYFIASKNMEIVKFANAVRAHWSIENNVHHFLDVSLSEDLIRVRNQNAAHNLAILRRMVINIIEQHKQPKISKRSMLLTAGWNNDYLKSLLFQQL